MELPDPRFPPLITGCPVDVTEHAFEVACERAANGELGAADLVWNRSKDTIDLALILEPDVALEKAREMFPLAATALMDSLGALMPPMTKALLRWPCTILVNDAAAGALQFASSSTIDADVPDWIVIGASLRLMHPPGAAEPGAEPNVTTLFAEGGGDLDRNRILESYAAHLLTWIHTWQDEGFAPVHEQLIGRIEGHEEAAPIHTGTEGAIVGRVLALTDDMQLLVKSELDNTVNALALADALQHRDRPATD